MRQNLADPRPSMAQPVVGAVPQSEEEPDVTRSGTVHFARLSCLLTSHLLRLAL
jgi:hypothetical protein